MLTLRKWHSLPGLCLALMLAITAGTGAILAVDAGIEAGSAPDTPAAAIRLADLAARISEQIPTVEKITRAPSGRVRVTYLEEGRPQSVHVDPETGKPTEAVATSPALRTITNLHRAWLAGDGGRLAAGLSAAAMLMLAVTGLILLKRQTGGWRHLARPLGGSGMRRWHLELGRLAAAGLLLSSATAIQLSLTGFEILPDGSAAQDVFVTGSGGARAPLRSLDGLTTVTLAELREMVWPDVSDASDPFRVKTDRSIRFVDAATGAILAEGSHSLAWHIQDVAYRLHTAQGMAMLAGVLAASAIAGLLLALTGLAVGLGKRRRSDAIKGGVSADTADILVLVGSEGGTTWRFAETLMRALSAAGRKVHVAAMNDLPPASPARQMIFLAATAGDGEAPASATRCIARLGQWQGAKPEAVVLGFGSREFPNFCAYADTLDAALRDHGFRIALPTERIDRQSVDAFAAWGVQLGDRLGLRLSLEHRAGTADLHRFELIERRDYGSEVQAPTAILRFRIVPPYRLLPSALQRALGLLPRFEAGDLVAITPPGDQRPRYYSIASSSLSGVLELCVRQQPGGRCSGYLCGLQPGARLEAAIRPNPTFRPDTGKGPLILIGAGAGIAPLIGFLRQKGGMRPVQLYWGGRDPHSDFLYRDELEAHAAEGRLTRLRTIFSRSGSGGYVQDLVTGDAADLRATIAAGGQILVCGSRQMAEGVRQALGLVLAPLGLDASTLRQNGRLIEDVY